MKPIVKLRFLGFQEGPGVRFALYNITASELPALVAGSTVSLHTVAAAGARPVFEDALTRAERYTGSLLSRPA